MDSKQATRKVSGQASWLVRVICNRKKIVRKIKIFFNFFSKKLSLTVLRIKDPGSGAFLTPGSGMGKKSGSGSRGRGPDPQHWNIFTHFFSSFFHKIVTNSVEDLGSRNRMGKKNQDPDQGFWIRNTGTIFFIFFLT